MRNTARILASIFVLVLVMGSINLATAQSFIVEYIEEESSNRGYYPIYLYRDSEACGWMCNSGKPATWYDPADYIFEFYVPNSYDNLNRLRITGTNPTADCYIKGGVSARVYSNNIIRACVGYNSVFFCGLFPRLNDVAVWIE